MQSSKITTMPTDSVYVYPLPAKTQGPEGNSKAYRISLGILWFCFALPILATVFNIPEVIFSYISTNIFILFFVVYFEFYKNPVFLYLLLLTAGLVLPAAYMTEFITPFIPRYSHRPFGEGHPYLEINFVIGCIFFILLHVINIFMRVCFRKSIQKFIAIIFLCETSSFIFYFTCFFIQNRIYEKINNAP